MKRTRVLHPRHYCLPTTRSPNSCFACQCRLAGRAHCCFSTNALISRYRDLIGWAERPSVHMLTAVRLQLTITMQQFHMLRYFILLMPPHSVSHENQLHVEGLTCAKASDKLQTCPLTLTTYTSMDLCMLTAN